MSILKFCSRQLSELKIVHLWEMVDCGSSKIRCAVVKRWALAYIIRFHKDHFFPGIWHCINMLMATFYARFGSVHWHLCTC